MSRIIDNLNKNLEKESFDSTQERLIDTFFSGASKKEDAKKSINFLPAIIGATFLAVLVIFFSLSFNIEVSLKDDVKDMAENIRSFVVPARGLYIIENGKPNKSIVKDISFLGDARKYSKIKDNFIMLVNSKGNGWGSASIKFLRPIDMKDLTVSYLASGQVGGEKLSLTLIDNDNKAYRIDNNYSLSKKKDKYKTELNNAERMLDISNIREIQFEFGSLTSGNVPGSTIFLENIEAKRMES